MVVGGDGDGGCDGGWVVVVVMVVMVVGVVVMVGCVVFSISLQPPERSLNGIAQHRWGHHTLVCYSLFQRHDDHHWNGCMG